MELVGLWRYPVKSLQGQRVETASFEHDGLSGDREWGVRDLRTGRILTARRRPELLAATATYEDGLPVIALPEYFADATDDNSEAIEWTMPAGRYVDASPVLVLTTASLRTAAHLHPDGVWDPRRFRPNALIDVDGEGWLEDDWVGQSLRIGAVTLVPAQPCVRCTMVTRAQPGHLGVWCDVLVPNHVSVGERAMVGAVRSQGGLAHRGAVRHDRS